MEKWFKLRARVSVRRKVVAMRDNYSRARARANEIPNLSIRAQGEGFAILGEPGVLFGETNISPRSEAATNGRAITLMARLKRSDGRAPITVPRLLLLLTNLAVDN